MPLLPRMRVPQEHLRPVFAEKSDGRTVRYVSLNGKFQLSQRIEDDTSTVQVLQTIDWYDPVTDSIKSDTRSVLYILEEDYM